MYINRGIFQHLTRRELSLPICKILNSLKIGVEILPSHYIHLPSIFCAFRMTSKFSCKITANFIVRIVLLYVGVLLIAMSCLFINFFTGQ